MNQTPKCPACGHEKSLIKDAYEDDRSFDEYVRSCLKCRHEWLWNPDEAEREEPKREYEISPWGYGKTRMRLTGGGNLKIDFGKHGRTWELFTEAGWKQMKAAGDALFALDE